MREIEFRGKRIGTGEWVYGGYMKSPDHVSIWEGSESGGHFGAHVHHKTVGQYTGLNDKNGVKIFEGDIVRILYPDWASKSSYDPRTIEQYKIDIAKVGEVQYGVCQFCINFGKDVAEYDNVGGFNVADHGYIEIIGNIHDNPELLEPTKEREK
jgi:uncharacterized phage protein (TIGR01671 family)